jgi:hypothetical protein
MKTAAAREKNTLDSRLACRISKENLQTYSLLAFQNDRHFPDIETLHTTKAYFASSSRQDLENPSDATKETAFPRRAAV